jgi:hypothetical protein
MPFWFTPYLLLMRLSRAKVHANWERNGDKKMTLSQEMMDISCSLLFHQSVG